MSSLLSRIGRQLDLGWFSRLLVLFQLWFVWFIVDWSMAFGSTALAVKADLLGAAAMIGAVAAIPQALLMLATKSYMEMRVQHPLIVQGRRREDVQDAASGD